LVAFPTETVYGLGGNGLDASASEKIYRAKGRPSDNPLILHISKREDLDPIVREISPVAEALMDRFWPGPMTLIFPKADIVPYETTGGLDTVAVRMPSHPGARALIDRAGVPIAAPSANTSGRPSPTRADHVREDLDGKIDMIVDGGPVGIGIESTIIDLTEDKPVILRPGYITKAMVAELVGQVEMDRGLTGADVAPKAPGMKYRHYAPKARMTVFEGDMDRVVETINREAQAYEPEAVGILTCEENKDRYPRGQVLVSGSRREKSISHGLYGALREFDRLGVEVIFSESFAGEDRSEAIMNRLLKAAGQHVEYIK
nr:threonylcarbamoyl-AMP synthase [Eubacterium sp.]